ncbi:MAG: hypothetical protein K1X79_07545 [Oligoflexia bacterium]|nr:hypothetical protein [Oligoflexia bacterium]
MQTVLIRLTRKARSEKGYTLLEYCAGAAVIASIIWGAMNYMGTNVGGFLRGVGDWATARTGEISS